MARQLDMEENTGELIRLSFFTNMARSIAAANSIKETLRLVMRHITEIFAPRSWSLLMRDAATGDLVFSIVAGGPEAEQIRSMRLARGQGVAGWIAENKQSVIIEDAQNDPRFDPSTDAMTDFVTRSIIGVPLISRGRVFGVIELINKLNGESFSPLDLKVLMTIADFAAIAIEKAYYRRALRSMALVDDLTGMSNRRALSRAMEREEARSKRARTTTALIVIDIDSFKQINDTHGHAAGDEVLRHLAKVISGCVREVDLVCRYGGDEFTVLMPNTPLAEAMEVRDRIRIAVERAAKEGQEIAEADPDAEGNSSGLRAPLVAYSISTGVHAAGPDEFHTLFKAADLHLYAEKGRKNPRNIDEIGQHITEFMDDDVT